MADLNRIHGRDPNTAVSRPWLPEDSEGRTLGAMVKLGGFLGAVCGLAPIANVALTVLGWIGGSELVKHFKHRPAEQS